MKNKSIKIFGGITTIFIITLSITPATMAWEEKPMDGQGMLGPTPKAEEPKPTTRPCYPPEPINDDTIYFPLPLPGPIGVITDAVGTLESGSENELNEFYNNPQEVIESLFDD